MKSLVILAIALSSIQGKPGIWRELPAIPDSEGFAGVFAGVSGNALIVAGGANFPGKRPWEGGKKEWYDSIYALERPNGVWKRVGQIPRPLGYGVSATFHGSVICVGGSDAIRHYSDVFCMRYRRGKIENQSLPSLSFPLANACGAVVGNDLYVAGGQRAPDSKSAESSVYRLNLKMRSPTWDSVTSFPVPGRILSVAASFDGAFWVVGGAELVDGGRRYLRDAYRYDAKRGWKRISDLPYPVVAAPSPTPADRSGFYIVGGDDGSRAGFAPPESHPGFRRTVLRYDKRSDNWPDSGEVPASRVTTPCVFWNGQWVVPSGEARPGIRSPSVWSYQPVIEVTNPVW